MRHGISCSQGGERPASPTYCYLRLATLRGQRLGSRLYMTRPLPRRNGSPQIHHQARFFCVSGGRSGRGLDAFMSSALPPRGAADIAVEPGPPSSISVFRRTGCRAAETFAPPGVSLTTPRCGWKAATRHPSPRADDHLLQFICICCWKFQSTPDDTMPMRMRHDHLVRSSRRWISPTVCRQCCPSCCTTATPAGDKAANCIR